MARRGGGYHARLGEEPPAPWEEAPRSRPARQGPRVRGSRRRTSQRRWSPAKLWLLGAGAAALALVAALLVFLLGGEEADEPAEEEAEALPPEALVERFPPQEHGALGEVAGWDPAEHGLDEDIGALCQTVGESAAQSLAAYELSNTGPNHCTWEGLAQHDAESSLRLMLHGPAEDIEELYVQELGEQIRAAREGPDGAEAGPVYALPAGDEGFIRHSVRGSGEQATADVYAGMRHGAYMTVLAHEDAPLQDEEHLYAGVTDLLTALAQ